MHKTRTKPDVAAIVRRYLQHRQPQAYRLDVVEEGAWEDGGWWHVPVRPSKDPPKMFEYFEILADVEGEIEEKEKIKLLLVPAVPADAIEE